MANLESKIDELLDCMKFLTIKFENLGNKLVLLEKEQAILDKKVLERASREVARLEERIATPENELALTRENTKNLLAKEAHSKRFNPLIHGLEKSNAKTWDSKFKTILLQA